VVAVFSIIFVFYCVTISEHPERKNIDKTGFLEENTIESEFELSEAYTSDW